MQFAFLTLQPIKGYLYNNRQPNSFLSGSERRGIIRLAGRMECKLRLGHRQRRCPQALS